MADTPESNRHFITVDVKIVTSSLISIPAQLLKEKDAYHLGTGYETPMRP